MGTTLHVFDFLEKPPRFAPVNIVFGDEPFLKHLAIVGLREQVLAGNDVPFAQFDDLSLQWRDVADELRTVSLFNAGGNRLVTVLGADPFVTKYRGQLEKYVEHPERHGVLILEVGKWAANTRLYKMVDKSGVQVECRAPLSGRGKQKTVDQGRLISWMIQWAKSRHEVQLARNAAVQLLDLIGPEFGLLDNEIAKLALYTDGKGKITEALVRQVAGGWRTKTIWELLDAALSGNTAEALRQLDRLFQSGQDPAALFGPISWSLRRFAAATRLYQRSERHGRRIRLPDALEQAGFYKWQTTAFQQAEKQLKQLGRDRAGQFYQWLLEVDLALKGTHSSPAMARLMLERLLIRMSQQLAPARQRPPRPQRKTIVPNTES